MRPLGAAAALACALFAAGCSYQLDGMNVKDDAALDQTGSIGHTAAPKGPAAEPSPSDLAYARAAASDLLANGGKDMSVPWQNPQSGASGNVTPIASAYTESGLPCHDFLASYINGNAQLWLAGAACRTSDGRWEVKTLAPLKHG